MKLSETQGPSARWRPSARSGELEQLFQAKAEIGGVADASRLLIRVVDRGKYRPTVRKELQALTTLWAGLERPVRAVGRDDPHVPGAFPVVTHLERPFEDDLDVTGGVPVSGDIEVRGVFDRHHDGRPGHPIFSVDVDDRHLAAEEILEFEFIPPAKKISLESLHHHASDRETLERQSISVGLATPFVDCCSQRVASRASSAISWSAARRAGAITVPMTVANGTSGGAGAGVRRITSSAPLRPAMALSSASRDGVGGAVPSAQGMAITGGRPAGSFHDRPISPEEAG